MSGGFAQPLPTAPWTKSPPTAPGNATDEATTTALRDSATIEAEHAPHIFSFRVRINEETNRISVEMLDPATGEVVRQIPPEELERFIAAMQRHIGQILDRHV